MWTTNQLFGRRLPHSISSPHSSQSHTWSTLCSRLVHNFPVSLEIQNPSLALNFLYISPNLLSCCAFLSLSAFLSLRCSFLTCDIKMILTKADGRFKRIKHRSHRVPSWTSHLRSRIFEKQLLTQQTSSVYYTCILSSLLKWALLTPHFSLSPPTMLLNTHKHTHTPLLDSLTCWLSSGRVKMSLNTMPLVAN